MLIPLLHAATSLHIFSTSSKNQKSFISRIKLQLSILQIHLQCTLVLSQNMPHILEDPTQATCPSFESAEWSFLQQSMVEAHQGAPPFTDEDATWQLKETWARENGSKIATWNAQLKQD